MITATAITFADKLNLTSEMSHDERYNAIIDFLGYENVKRCIPFDLTTLKDAYEKDIWLNNLSMKKWDIASGFYCKGPNVEPMSSPLRSLIRDKGVNCYSNAGGVCILKQCARRWIEEE